MTGADRSIRWSTAAAVIRVAVVAAADLPEPQTASASPASAALSKDLRKQGWKFVRPVMVHAFMQAMGLINDHVEDCVIRVRVEHERAAFTRPGC